MGWMDHDFRNHIPAPQTSALKLIEAHIATATKYIQTTGLSEMAAYTQDGY